MAPENHSRFILLRFVIATHVVPCRLCNHHDSLRRLCQKLFPHGVVHAYVLRHSIHHVLQLPQDIVVQLLASMILLAHSGRFVVVVEVDLRVLPGLTIVREQEPGVVIHGPVADGDRRTSPTLYVVEAVLAIGDKRKGVVVPFELTTCFTHCSGPSFQNFKKLWRRRRAMPDLISGNLTVLGADVEMQRGARAFLRKVVRPTFFARVPHVASSVRGNQGVFVVCQTQHCGSLAADPPGMPFAEPLSFQMSLASFSATRGPLALGSCVSRRCCRLLARETFSFSGVGRGHVVSLGKSCSANCLTLHLFAMALAIVEAVGRRL